MNHTRDRAPVRIGPKGVETPNMTTPTPSSPGTDEPTPPAEPLGPVEVPEPDVVDIPEPDVVDIPERRLRLT
jgi:hypothetical protein